MRTQSRLQKITTAVSLFSMATSFSVLGFLIVVNQHDGGASIPGGIFGVLLGATFLIAACLHLKQRLLRRANEAESIATVHRAIEKGTKLASTSLSYKNKYR